MSSAGQQFVAGHIPGELIAKTVLAADSAAVSAEAVVMTVVAPLVTGRTYEIAFYGNIRAETGDRTLTRIREDGLLGTELQGSDQSFDTGTGSTRGRDTTAEAEHTAASSGSKTFVVTLERILGTGVVVLEGNGPAFLRVYYQEG